MKSVILLLCCLFCHSGPCLASQQSAAQQQQQHPAPSAAEPAFLGSYDVEDACQFRLCGPDHLPEFLGGKTPTVGSCSGDCDDLARRLVDSKFKKEFLWGKCTGMCNEKYPTKEYRSYTERLTCMDECFDAFEAVAPHHRVAQACVHAACTATAREKSGQTAFECFERCTHHVATRVPKDDWAAWAALLPAAVCGGNAGGGAGIADLKQQDRLACADQALWAQLTAKTSVTPDVHLLCLNAMCDNSVACAKQCLRHVTSAAVSAEDLPRWQQCTYSSACAEIHAYALREACADGCVEATKAEARRKADLLRRDEETRRRKEAEAMLSMSKGSRHIGASLLTMLLLLLKGLQSVLWA